MAEEMIRRELLDARRALRSSRDGDGGPRRRKNRGELETSGSQQLSKQTQPMQLVLRCDYCDAKELRLHLVCTMERAVKRNRKERDFVGPHIGIKPVFVSRQIV